VKHNSIWEVIPVTKAIKLTCAIFVIIFLAPVVIPVILTVAGAILPFVVGGWLIWYFGSKLLFGRKPQIKRPNVVLMVRKYTGELTKK
jgi:hypothetical protein